MKTRQFLPMLSLQLFADGGAAGDSGTARGAGVTGSDAGAQNTGAGNPPNASDAGVQAQPTDRKAEFERLIKGDYKDLYDANVQSIVQSRLKNSRETVDRYNALTPLLELIGAKYGIEDTGDVQSLVKAVEEDDSFFEEEALKRGLTVEQYKGIRKMERENAELKRQMQAQQQRENADKLYASWMNQAAELKQVYPSFDLQAEMGNEQFTRLLRSGVPIRTAFEVLHKDEILPAAMQYTAKTVEKKLAASIASGQNRPTENGNASQSASTITSDVSKLTKQQRRELIRRAAAGEKIRF